jgi:hypothetical protein
MVCASAALFSIVIAPNPNEKRRGVMLAQEGNRVLNRVIEQDHVFASTRRTREDMETMHLIRKGRVRRLAKKDVVAGALFVPVPTLRHRCLAVLGSTPSHSPSSYAIKTSRQNRFMNLSFLPCVLY